MSVGEMVPVYRMSQRHWTANELTNAALVLACSIKGDLAATDELDAWAERAASADADDLISAKTPFSDHGVSVFLETYEPRVLQVNVNVEERLTQDEIGGDAALAIAHDAIRRLEQFGMTQHAFDPDPIDGHTLTHHIGGSDEKGVRTIVELYSLSFGVRRGDLEVAGPRLQMEITASGTLRSLAWSEVDVVDAGTARVMLDASGADARLRELVIGPNPLPEGVQANFSHSRTAYRLGSQEAEADVGPRWLSRYNFSSERGGVSWTRVSAVSMTDPTTPLIPIAP